MMNESLRFKFVVVVTTYLHMCEVVSFAFKDDIVCTNIISVTYCNSPNVFYTYYIYIFVRSTRRIRQGSRSVAHQVSKDVIVRKRNFLIFNLLF